MAGSVPGAGFVAGKLPSGLTAVMFTADWCGYCRRFQPHFDTVPNAVVVDISDEDDPLWDQYAIHVVPTVILFEKGAPTRRWAGPLRESHASEILAAVKQ